MRRLALLAALCTACRPSPPLPIEPSPPCLLVAPAELDFGEVPNGAVRSGRLEVTNTSDSVRTVEFEMSGPSSFTLDQLHSVALGPGEATGRIVRFVHDDSRLHLGTLAFDAGPDCQASMPLRGLGQGAIELEPATIDFGFVQPGQRKTLEVRLTNKRRTPVMLSIGLGSSPTEVFTTTLPNELELPPLTTLPFSVTAAPPSDLAYQAALVALFDGLNRVQSNLVVVGGAPVAELSDRAIVVPTAGFAVPSFPPTFVDRVQRVRNVSLQGRAVEARLRIVSPEFKVESLDGGATDLTVTIPDVALAGLFPGEEAPLELHFRPSSLGPRSYRVTLFTNDPVQPEQVFTFEANVEALPECSLSFAPTGLFRLTQFPDGTSTGTITFTNTGSTMCVVDDLRLEEPATAVFVLHAPTQLLLAPGESRSVTVDGPITPVSMMSTFGFHVLNANSVRQRITLLDY